MMYLLFHTKSIEIFLSRVVIIVCSIFCIFIMGVLGYYFITQPYYALYLIYDLVLYIIKAIFIIFWLPVLILFLSFKYWFIPQIKRGKFYKLTTDNDFPQYMYIDTNNNHFNLYIEKNITNQKTIYYIEQTTKKRLFGNMGVVLFLLNILNWQFFPFSNYTKQLFLKYLYRLAIKETSS